jgi:hypothetical protein
MAYLLFFLVPVALIGGFALGAWLKKHPGHPILQEIDDFVLQEARMLALGKAAQVLASKGISFPQQIAGATTATATGGSSPPTQAK